MAKNILLKHRYFPIDRGDEANKLFKKLERLLGRDSFTQIAFANVIEYDPDTNCFIMVTPRNPDENAIRIIDAKD